MRYVNLIGSSYLKIYPDSGNITNAAVRYGTDVLKDLETGTGHLVAMHLKEALPGRFREIRYGEGHVDFKAMINKAWELGIRKFVTEFWYTETCGRGSACKNRRHILIKLIETAPYDTCKSTPCSVTHVYYQAYDIRGYSTFDFAQHTYQSELMYL